MVKVAIAASIEVEETEEVEEVKKVEEVEEIRQKSKKRNPTTPKLPRRARQTEKNEEILAAVATEGTISKAARKLGISRQRVHQVVSKDKKDQLRRKD